jgi:hypothetical protein
MQWAPDSPELWGRGSGRPSHWAPDPFEHLHFAEGPVWSSAA